MARTAHQVLINTSAIGGLSFGLLFGQLATALVAREAKDGFLHRVEGLALPIRLAAFVVFAVLPVALLFVKK